MQIDEKAIKILHLESVNNQILQYNVGNFSLVTLARLGLSVPSGTPLMSNPAYATGGYINLAILVSGDGDESRLWKSEGENGRQWNIVDVFGTDQVHSRLIVTHRVQHRLSIHRPHCRATTCETMV